MSCVGTWSTKTVPKLPTACRKEGNASAMQKSQFVQDSKLVVAPVQEHVAQGGRGSKDPPRLMMPKMRPP